MGEADPSSMRSQARRARRVPDVFPTLAIVAARVAALMRRGAR